MKSTSDVRSPRTHLASIATTVLALTLFATAAPAQGTLQIANPHWNITLSDFGYSDFMLDNTPGFEGREYLSGEWGAAVGYQPASGSAVTPQWLEPNFLFPDWATMSTFRVVTPIALTGQNADGLPIAQSVVANNHLEVTLRHEMIDTIIGTPMGTTPASTAGAGTSLKSDRYVLKQTATIRNISGATINNLQFFQFLHGWQSQRGLYDNRTYAGPLGDFRYDVTLAGVDAGAVGAGSSTAGLEDFVGFQSTLLPSAFEIGHYGIDGNGIDDHFIGKPSDGVHLSVENNWQSQPYAARQGTDLFAPTNRWVAGAQRWDLGNLAPAQTLSMDVVLALRTGTKVTPGTLVTGGCNGGSSVPGGVDYEFEDVSSEGSCFGEYSKADTAEIELHIASGDFEPFSFLTPGGPVQLWQLQFSGVSAGAIHLTFAYDATILPQGFDESALCIYQFNGNTWDKLPGVVNAAAKTIVVTTTALSSFALGVDTANVFVMDAAVSPPNSGVIAGARAYPQGASVTLVATANPGYVFANWTENSAVVSSSPSYTFPATAARTLVANFATVSTGQVITTAATPSNGGSTTGDAEYAQGSSATVVATPNAGYKFSKWLENGATVSLSASYTFTVAGNRSLVAKFKPVYNVTVTPDPAVGGEVDSDIIYEFGELAVLKAKPNAGYCFVNWTQNGLPVSDNPIYQFNVTGNRDLVGNFALGNIVKVTTDSPSAGTLEGSGIYPAGASVTVVATPNPGYAFHNWTEAGTPVSTSASFTFTSDASYTLYANFIAQPRLTAAAAPGLLTISWPVSATPWVLQQNGDLSTLNWRDVTNEVTVVDGQNRVTVPSAPGQTFFRLVH